MTKQDVPQSSVRVVEVRRDSKGRFVKGHKQLNTGRTCFKKGQVSPRKGISMSDDQKRKLSVINKGKKLSLSTRLKMSKSRSGDKNHAWIDGRSSDKRHRNRNVFGYELWRFSVYVRDGFTCRKCDTMYDSGSGRLVAHHIMSYDKYPELCVSIDNGITLCKKCHTGFHSIYGYGNNNDKQLDEFLQL